MADGKIENHEQEAPELEAAHSEYRTLLRERIRTLERSQLEIAKAQEKLNVARVGVEEELSALERTLAAVESLSPVLAVAHDDRKPLPTNYERIVAFLCDQTEGRTIAEIEAGTDVARSSVSAVLYRTHAADFMRFEKEGSRANTWWLKAQFDLIYPSARSGGNEEVPF